MFIKVIVMQCSASESQSKRELLCKQHRRLFLDETTIPEIEPFKSNLIAATTTELCQKHRRRRLVCEGISQNS
jgi:hypothetical protein